MRKTDEELVKKNITQAVALIPTGRINARSMKTIASILETETRTVRSIVERARLMGIPICGDDSGYYFPADTNELKTFYFRARKRSRSSAAVTQAIYDALIARGVNVTEEGD